eukprot:TCALIF_00476-PA protein Name:"Similar to Atp5sl ATP synthase subunit s-like protein (Rattus norvegicus)" AED:0.12 eAED:0.13 QI:0/0/0/1/0/0/2/0/333
MSRLGGLAFRRAYWWGHDTLEDQKTREIMKKAANQVLRPVETGVVERKSSSIIPARVVDEASTLVRDDRFSFVPGQFYSITARPILPRFFDRAYYKYELIRKTYVRLAESQLFIKSRFTSLGSDLGAAHFLCYRNCRVRFVGHDHWTELDGGQLMIPNSYQPGWFIEAIDASQSLLVYEGYQNLRNLIHLRYLDVSYTQHTDDWTVDRITTEYMDSLEYLDLSGCGGINLSGLECLWRLRKLKTLVLYDMDHVEHLGLLCLYLLELYPDLDIRGVEYIDVKLLEGTEHSYLLEDLEDELLKLPEVQSLASKSTLNSSETSEASTLKHRNAKSN